MFSIVPIPVPVPVLFLVPCSVNEPLVLHEKFQFWGEGVFLVSSEPKFLSLPWEVSIMGEGFLIRSEPKSLCPPWEVPIWGGGGGILGLPRIGYSVWFWQQNLPTPASYCMTDSLSHTMSMCVETNEISTF